MALTSAIIKRFNLQVDDSSELSSDEELALAQEVYEDIQNDRPWEWLKEEATGTMSTSVDYIALESDFKNISQNSENRSIVFVGDDNSEYRVIPFSSRRNFRDSSGFCYIDIPNQRLVFTLQPTEAKSVEYDYIKIAPALTTSTAPLFTGHDNLISYGMAAKFNPIELSDKATSYRKENKSEYNNMLSDMRYEDANIKLSLS